MSSSVSNSSARRRRTKDTSKVKQQINNYDNLSNNTDMASDNFVPVLGIKESIYMLNKRVSLLTELVSVNKSDNEILKINEKLNNLTVNQEIKINLLEKEIESLRSDILEINTIVRDQKEIINKQQIFFDKMQSLAAYDDYEETNNNETDRFLIESTTETK